MVLKDFPLDKARDVTQQLKVSKYEVAGMEHEPTLPEVLGIRIKAVLSTNPKPFEGITPGNAHVGLRRTFGIEVPKEGNAAWTLALRMKKGAGLSL